MLHSPGVINSVINSLNKIKVKKIILDPVIVAKGGAKLINDKAIQILKNKLLKKVTLITPNIFETEILTKTKIKTIEDMIYAANIFLNLGAKNILVKGGHLNSKIVQDVFVNKSEIKIFKHKKITTKNTHGTGCTLSSAITTYFSCGKPLKKSCELGIKYVNHAIGSNLNYGKGHGPINHLNSIIVNKKFR
jgi:hydroxymethylpyrimidine/phosphomethylpyrimidine kinase